ncbi:hypothetical protein [Sorangium cellulosum]|uniref:hypothetical protein n=1 Tax=Sorangium cellulosum TaxID=56 RepID=UPI001F3B7225|nr:hypothetical protein [Sorangium cellulosum]
MLVPERGERAEQASEGEAAVGQEEAPGRGVEPLLGRRGEDAGDPPSSPSSENGGGWSSGGSAIWAARASSRRTARWAAP